MGPRLWIAIFFDIRLPVSQPVCRGDHFNSNCSELTFITRSHIAWPPIISMPDKPSLFTEESPSNKVRPYM